MIKLKPGFHMIATIAVIAAIAEKKKKLQRSQRSYETTLQRSQRQQSLRYKKFYLSDRCRCDRWRVVSIWSLNFFFSAIAAITAIVAIIWKPGLIYRNNHPPFLLNCYLYALQTYRTHSSKLRLLLVSAILRNTKLKRFRFSRNHAARVVSLESFHSWIQ